MKRTRWLIKRCRRNLTFVEGRIFISDFLNASWMHMRCHAYLCRFSRLKPRNRLRKCVSAKSWCRSLESYWFTSVIYVVNRYFFFFFLKRNDLVVAIFFSRAITFCVHDIFEKRKKRKTQIPFNRWYIPIFFIKITYKTMRLFFKKIRYIYPVDSS